MEKYKNPELSIRERTNDLLEKMTIEEKVGQVNQHLYGWQSYKLANHTIELTDDFKKHVQWGKGLGALYGLFRADPWSKVDEKNGIAAQDSWEVANEIQNYVVSQSRFGIPALFAEECPHGHQGLQSVSYPTNIGRGNTFNKELIEETSRMMARELTSKGIHLALVSTLDLARDPRWGRTEESFGEDPFLAAEFSKAVVKGFQDDLITKEPFLDLPVKNAGIAQEQMGVVLKHCLAQGDAIGGHNAGAVNIGNREFMDVHYPLLRSAKHAVGVMAAYNDIDGIPCHASPYLLETLLREKEGYQGIVMADGTALDRLVSVYGSHEKAAFQGLKAGVDLSLWDKAYLTIGKGISQQVISEELLNKAVFRVLSIKFLLGLFDQPYVSDGSNAYLEMMNQFQEKNLQIAEESITLLKNEECLPLSSKKETIAMIGPNANNIYHLLGDYTSPQSEDMAKKTLLNGIREGLSDKKVIYAQGCEVRNSENQEELLEEASIKAEEADKILLVLGGSSARNFDMEFLKNGAVSSKGINMDSGENVDVASLELGGKQLELFRRINTLGKPIITVLVQGRPHEIDEIVSSSAAVLVVWYPGQMGGEALANILTGRVSPSGKLSLSYPRSSSQLPVYYYQRDIAMNENYYDMSGAPLFEFGYGESYTTFQYEDLTILTKDVKEALESTGKISIEVTISNTGNKKGKESILLYVKLIGGNVIQRKKMLRGFEKMTLSPRERKTVHFDLFFEDICYYDMDNEFKLSEGIEIEVGSLETSIVFE